MITKTRIAGIPLRPLLHNEKVPAEGQPSLARCVDTESRRDTHGLIAQLVMRGACPGQQGRVHKTQTHGAQGVEKRGELHIKS